MENAMNRERLIQILKDWETADEDPEDAAYEYFEATGLRNWVDILYEAKEIYEEVYGEPIEELSPEEALLSGVAAQASKGTWLTIASALGWDAHLLSVALAGWQEADENGAYEKKIITLEELKALYEEEIAYRKEMKAMYEKDRARREELYGDN